MDQLGHCSVADPYDSDVSTTRRALLSWVGPLAQLHNLPKWEAHGREVRRPASPEKLERGKMGVLYIGLLQEPTQQLQYVGRIESHVFPCGMPPYWFAIFSI